MKKLYISAIIALAASSLSTSAQVTQEEKDFRKWEEVIASDSFGGRAPLTLYETKTINGKSQKICVPFAALTGLLLAKEEEAVL